MKNAIVFNDKRDEVHVWFFNDKKSRDLAYLNLFKLLDNDKIFDKTKLSQSELQLYTLAKRENSCYARAFILISDIDVKETNIKFTKINENIDIDVNLND